MPKTNTKKNSGPLFRSIIAYKIQGHETWRFEVKRSLKEFEENWKIGPHPSIIALKTWRADVLNGVIIENIHE